jgi:NitT/TauT family transport system substrate-binding protein
MPDLRPLLLCAALIVSWLFQGLSQAATDGTEPLPRVRIALQWRPQSQFAGFYMAQQQGFYADAGARVSLVHANAVDSSLDWLEAGKVELATAFLADAMVAAAGADAMHLNGTQADVRPVLIGQLVWRSNLMLVAWKDDGITHLQDLDGRRVSLMSGPFSAAVRALLAERQIQPELVPQYGTVNLFLHRGVSACAAMEYNELHRLWQAGVDRDRLTVFSLRNLGFDIPEDGLYARSDWLADHDELAQRLLQATLKGWDYARKHPEQALDLVLAEAERARVPANRPHERWMLEHMLASIFPDRSDSRSARGHLSTSAFATTAKALIAAGLMDEAPPFAVFCPRCGGEEEGSLTRDESWPSSDATPSATPVEGARASTDDTAERR